MSDRKITAAEKQTLISLQTRVANDILKTPTGAARNLLCDINLLLMAATEDPIFDEGGLKIFEIDAPKRK